MKPVATTEVKKGEVKPHDALALLSADHAAIAGMLRDYERHKHGDPVAKGDQVDKGKRALRICHRLSIHTAIEEEIFYPAAAAVLGDKAGDLLEHARADHAAIRALVSKLEQTPASEPAFDAAMKELADHVGRHVKEVEGELFAKLRHSKLDLAGTGEKLASRQLQLSTAPADKTVFREGRRVMGG